MSLPKINHPIVEIEIPSLHRKMMFRPFLVSEEKIMLMAAASEQDSPLLATKQILNNCCLEPLDVNSLASFDLEYLFIKLRSVSVSNFLDMTFGEEQVRINLDDVKIFYPENKSSKIMLSEKDKIGVVLKYPTYDDLEEFERSDKSFILKTVIKQIFQGEQVFDIKDYTEEEVQTFLDSLSVPQMNKIEEWIQQLPYVYLEVTLKNGTTRRLRGIHDFFG